jgi:TonB family protein
MASFPQFGCRVRRTLALVRGPLLVPLLAAAQSTSPDLKPVVLDARSASRLIQAQANPEYPPIAKHNFIQGRVRVQVVVTREGQVREAHVIHGHPFLAASALRAVRRWHYRPLTTRSGPAEFLTLVDVNFTLRSKKIEQVPSQPERDLKRQIKPPQVVETPAHEGGSASVQLRVLVDEKGRVIDSEPEGGLPSQFQAAQRTVEHWTFRPARWGSLPVPWYVDINVPVRDYPN